jgi:hypothetical protein
VAAHSSDNQRTWARRTWHEVDPVAWTTRPAICDTTDRVLITLSYLTGGCRLQPFYFDEPVVELLLRPSMTLATKFA